MPSPTRRHLITGATATAASAVLGAPAFAQKAPLRIGANLEFSGGLELFGNQAKLGLDLAAREINAAGGILGQPVEILYEDNRTDPKTAVERSTKLIGRDEVLRRYPGLAKEGLTGAGIFRDGQMYNPPRLVLAYVQSAVAAGAVCANYVEAVGLLERDQRVRGILARDMLGGGRFEIRGRMVLNAAGPYAETILQQGLGRALDPPTPFSRDAYFIVGRPLLSGDHALTVPSLSSGPHNVSSQVVRISWLYR